MKWLLNVLFMYGIKTIYSKTIDINKLLDKKEVDTFLGKILQAAKFDELADRIAERAVKKLNDFQKSTVSEPSASAADDKIYRSQTYSVPKRRGKNKHKHGKIDVDAVLKKAVSPIDGLKLRYKSLKDTQGNVKEGSEKNEKKFSHENDQHGFDEVAKDEDFDQNMKTLSDENFKNPYGDGETISWERKAPKYPGKEKLSLRRESNNSDVVGESLSKENRTDSKRTTRTEGDKQFIMEENPDYIDYDKQLAMIEKSSFKYN